MKKLFLSAVMLIGLAFASNAQEIGNNALGLRLGDNNGFGGEVSYQRTLGSNNRLELDLGWRNNDNDDAYKLVGLYQWVWNIDGGFNWYAGYGGGLGSYSSGVFFIAAGNLGVEYNFDIPLLLSLDIRPELYVVNDFRGDDFGPDIALSIRFQF
jgi:hypothetical protein